jgi:hypothetical protein
MTNRRTNGCHLSVKLPKHAPDLCVEFSFALLQTSQGKLKTQLAPSGPMPPPGTTQWRWGCRWRFTFRWKDYAHGSGQKTMTLAATEFLRRFFLHVLPKGFVRIRSFGFLANRWRARMLALARRLLGAAPVVAVERSFSGSFSSGLS